MNVIADFVRKRTMSDAAVSRRSLPISAATAADPPKTRAPMRRHRRMANFRRPKGSGIGIGNRERAEVVIRSRLMFRVHSIAIAASLMFAAAVVSAQDTRPARDRLQEHQGDERHRPQGDHPGDALDQSGAWRRLYALPHRDGVGPGRRPADEGQGARDVRDDDRDQSRELRRQAGRDLLHVPQGASDSGRHSRDARSADRG